LKQEEKVTMKTKEKESSSAAPAVLSAATW
jgi:hypothetical protein